MQDDLPTLSRAPTRAAAKVSPVSTPGTAELLTLAVFVVVVTGVYFAREVMVPITLAILLSFVLAPVVGGLRRIFVPRILAVLLSVALSLGVILALAGLIGLQIANLAGELPQYQPTIAHKIAVVQKLTLGPLSELIDRIGHATPAAAPPQKPANPAAQTGPQTGPQTGLQTGPLAAPQAKPVQVQVQEAPLTPLGIVRDFLAPILSPLATVAIVFIVAVFILLQQADLRDRLIRLFGSNDLHRTTLAMDDAGRRLSRYFLTQLGINAAFGCVICAGLAVIGTPNPVLWGILGALFRFVPYVGSWLSAVLPLTLAAAVDPGWSMTLWTAILYGVVELTVGQVVEPFLYGHSTGLSPVSVVVAAIFWSWLWGPIGLILSTPLTLCLVVLGRHVPRLEFLDVLLGDRPALTPIESFYQRILAGDADEALAQAEQMLRDRSLSSYYDEVVVKALRLAVLDVNRGLLLPDQTAAVIETVLELVSDLDTHDDQEPPQRRAADTPVALPERETMLPRRPPPGPDFAGSAVSPWDAAEPVLCVAGRGPLDDALTALLVQLLGKHGIGARAMPYAGVSRTQVQQLRPAETAMVCICHIEVGGEPTRLRYLLRRIRHQLPSASILVGLWPLSEDNDAGDGAGEGEGEGVESRMKLVIGADYGTSTLTETVNACLQEAKQRGEAYGRERLSA